MKPDPGPTAPREGSCLRNCARSCLIVVGIGVLMTAVGLYLANRNSFQSHPGSESVDEPAERPYDEWTHEEGADRSLEGEYLSEKGKTKFEIDSEERRFSFDSMIGGQFLLQTEIYPFKARRVSGGGTVIEISGADSRAGGWPTTSFRIERISENKIELDRIRPIGGGLGLFLKQPKRPLPGD